MEGDCLSVISKSVTAQRMATWVTADDITHRLDVLPLSGVSASGSEIKADPITVGCDPRVIGGLVLHPCDGGKIKLMQYPALGLSKCKDGTVICMTGWCDTCEVVEAKKEGPCDRYEKLQACYDDLLCGKAVASVTYNGRTVTYSRANIQQLGASVAEARAACMQVHCKGRPRRWGVRV